MHSCLWGLFGFPDFAKSLGQQQQPSFQSLAPLDWRCELDSRILMHIYVHEGFSVPQISPKTWASINNFPDLAKSLSQQQRPGLQGLALPNRSCELAFWILRHIHICEILAELGLDQAVMEIMGF